MVPSGHGDCPTGADTYASAWAFELGLEQEKHPADWSKHGNAAGPIRNQEMAKLGAALCFAFWDGKSRGTLNMIECAARAGIPIHVVPKAVRT